MHPVPHSNFDAHLDLVTGEPHPPGAALAKRLEDGLREHLADVGAPENWRDCGWSIDVQCAGLRLQVYFAPYSKEGSWLLAVAPLDQPGALARLFGRKAAPSAAALQQVCMLVHNILAGVPQVQNIQWMLGGPPEKVPHVQSPAALPWNAAL